ncbi:hypothetical protein JCM16814_31550 [Desulfobaculum senezii]
MAEVSIQTTQGRPILTMTGEWTFDVLAEHREAVCGALDGAQQLTVDLSGVTRVDAAFFQFLHALGREAEGRGAVVELAPEVPEAVRNLARVCGFAGPDGLDFGGARGGLTLPRIGGAEAGGTHGG